MAKYKVSNEQSMGEALSLWLDRYRLRRGTDETRVLQAWDELMGPSIVRQTTKKKVQNQILYVQLESAVVRKELLMVKSKIISSIFPSRGLSLSTRTLPLLFLFFFLVLEFSTICLKSFLSIRLKSKKCFIIKIQSKFFRLFLLLHQYLFFQQ